MNNIKDISKISELEDTYNNSCSLKFIDNWKLNKTYAHQFEKTTFNE